MSNKKSNDSMIGAAAGAAAVTIGMNLFRGLVCYAMDPENLVEEKKLLKENRDILMKNFTK